VSDKFLAKKETYLFRLCGGLSSTVTGLDFSRRLTDVFLVNPAKTLFE